MARLLREAEQRALELLKEHRLELDKLVELLLVNETVDGSEVYAIAGRPAGPSPPAVKPSQWRLTGPSRLWESKRRRTRRRGVVWGADRPSGRGTTGDTRE